MNKLTPAKARRRPSRAFVDGVSIRRHVARDKGVAKGTILRRPHASDLMKGGQRDMARCMQRSGSRRPTKLMISLVPSDRRTSAYEDMTQPHVKRLLRRRMVPNLCASSRHRASLISSGTVYPCSLCHNRGIGRG